MRGHDNRDTAKTIRDMVRRKIADGKTADSMRHNDLLHSRIPDPPQGRMPFVKPVVSLRGGDVRHLVQEGRKKAQFNKATGVFQTHSQPVVNKVFSGFL